MKIFKVLLIALAAIAICRPVGTTFADTPTLNRDEATSLAWLREFSKYKWDIYRGSGSEMGPMPAEPVLLALAVDERQRMDVLKGLLDYYGVPDPVVSYEYWEYSEGFITEDLELRTYFVGWSLRPGQFENCAYLEEMSIRELRKAIAGTEQFRLSEAYQALLEGSYSNLVVLAAWLYEDPTAYRAQLLDQSDVDQIISDTMPGPTESQFIINAGLNDAWYDPATSGQGFFITVYPNSWTIVMSWLTFDTVAPEQATAHLGDPCQRWFTAQGHYVGATADLVVYSASGGIFDRAAPAPKLEEIGTVHLEFEHCNSGVVSYDLPGISASGAIPIQRVAMDNTLPCEIFNIDATR